MSRSRHPIVTLTTDFGHADSYAAEVKGRLLAGCPGAVLVDITHDIPVHDVEMGRYILSRAVPAFPAGALHLAVVDPGVGSTRHALVVETATATLLGPDNGLLGPFLEGARIRALDPARVGAKPLAPTFHGRDLFAPAAARLAAGEPAAAFSTPFANPVFLPASGAKARILHVDRFGNCVTSVTSSDLEGHPWLGLRAGSRTVTRLVRTYADAAADEPVALIGSAGYLEIAFKGASAAERLELSRGTPVHLLT
ncbi:MAG: S-adenosyl-l-methionine hydroxide adenosyltransferase family protein [Acidobacteriota bacterium]